MRRKSCGKIFLLMVTNQKRCFWRIHYCRCWWSSYFFATHDAFAWTSLYLLPLQIEIHCPGADPIVTIKDLVSDTANNYDGECVVIKLSGSNFAFRFSLNCDESSISVNWSSLSSQPNVSIMVPVSGQNECCGEDKNANFHCEITREELILAKWTVLIKF